MRYHRLGECGLKVSEICLGTMTFGHSTDQDEARRIVDAAIEAGVNFFDTSNNYGNRKSESFLAEALGKRRRDVVIATKFFNPFGGGPNDSGASRVAIFNALEDSLRDLKTDYIDIYYLHHVDAQTPMAETLEALDDAVRQGKVRYIACSNHPAWRLCDALWLSEHRGLARFVCYQPQYSLVVRDIEQELVPLCREKGLGIVPWGPMAGGFLTGKYKPGQRERSGTRSAERWVWQDQAFAPDADQTLELLLAVAGQLGHSPAQVALRWVMDRPGVSSVIVGARTAAQFRDSLGAVSLTLPDDFRGRLTEVSTLPDRYPESFEKHMHERRNNAIQTPGAMPGVGA